MTAQIYAERIKEAREARGFTAQAFSEAIEVSKQAVSQFESGKNPPGAQTFQKIQDVTDLPIQFFITPPNQEITKAICWRSLKKFEFGERARIHTRFNWLRSIVRVMEENYIDFPPVNFPKFIEANVKSITLEKIEQIASELREFWGLGKGPISNLTQLLESNGAFIARIQTDSESMDAVSAWCSDKPIIFVSARKDIAARFRFDLAHELGHLMLHSNVDLENQEILDLIEKQANRFASSFLMPKETFSKEMFSFSLSHFRSMKKRWKVSMAAMAYWSKDLGIMTENQYAYFCRQRNSLNMRKLEPLDNEIPLDEPTVLNSSTILILENGREILSQLEEYRPSDIEELCQVPAGTLAPLPTNVVRLDFKNKQLTT